MSAAVSTPKNQLKETLLTNKLFQQFIVASSSETEKHPIGLN
jgi:hypothetical protein